MPTVNFHNGCGHEHWFATSSFAVLAHMVRTSIIVYVKIPGQILSEIMYYDDDEDMVIVYHLPNQLVMPLTNSVCILLDELEFSHVTFH